MLSKQFCVMGNLILHGKFNMIGGGGCRNFPRQVPKCKDVSKFLTKIISFNTAAGYRTLGPKMQSTAHGPFPI